MELAGWNENVFLDGSLSRPLIPTTARDRITGPNLLSFLTR